MNIKKWPAYFLVDFEMYVMLHVADGMLIGTNDLGNPYDIARLPLSPHKQVTKAEFDAGSIERRKLYPPPTATPAV